MKFIRYNANPKDWKTGDCVVRAVAAATQQSWDTVYEDLCKIGGKKCRMPNDTLVYSAYLKQHGFSEKKQKKHENGTKYSIKELVENYPNSIVVIHCTHHLTVAILGHLIDTWNPAYSTSGKFYLKVLVGEEYDEALNYLEWIKENKMSERMVV